MSESKELSTHRATDALDLPNDVLALPVPKMGEFLDEFADRRKYFRSWFLRQMVEGVHYGFPPGTEPKYDEDGNVLVRSKGRMLKVPVSQWKPRHCLYEAGADYAIELQRWRAQYTFCKELWEQLGSDPQLICVRCELLNSRNDVIAEAVGTANRSDHWGNPNTTAKIARKRAKVSAVRDALAFSDLFTVDLEDTQQADVPQVYDNPERSTETPRTAPRAARKKQPNELAQRMGELSARYRDMFTDDRDAFMSFLTVAVGRPITKMSDLTNADLDAFEGALNSAAEGELDAPPPEDKMKQPPPSDAPPWEIDDAANTAQEAKPKPEPKYFPPVDNEPEIEGGLF